MYTPTMHWGNKETEYFYKLTPEAIMDAVEYFDLRPTGRTLPLNSMENRVYEIEIENPDAKTPSENFVISKFYRPGRWNKEQIQEEHDFLNDLIKAEIPAIAPIMHNGESVFTHKETGLLFCLFPKKGGRHKDELQDEEIEILGRTLARLHTVGKQKVASHRVQLTPKTYGEGNLEMILEADVLPNHLRETYTNYVNQIVSLSSPLFEGRELQRIHGDCHWGNVLWDLGSEVAKPFFVDFDDMVRGFPVQDIWLLIPGRDREAMSQRNLLLGAYDEIAHFDYSSLKLVEPLRTLRYIHFTAWITKRWEDPSFKNAFPQFGTEAYWETQTADLREQIGLIQDSQTPEYY